MFNDNGTDGRAKRRTNPATKNVLADMRNNEINTIGWCFEAPVVWDTALPTNPKRSPILFQVSLPESKYSFQICTDFLKQTNIAICPQFAGNLTHHF